MKRIGAPLPGHPCLNNHGPKRDLAKGVANAELTLSVGCAPNFAESSSGARLPTSTHRCHSRLLYRRASQLFLFLYISHNEKPVHCTSQHNFIKISENRRPSLFYETPGILALAPPRIVILSHLLWVFLDSRFRFVRFFCMALSVRSAAFRIRSSHSVLLRLFLLIRLQLPSDLRLCQDNKSRCICALPPARPRQSLLTEAALI
jgi:hypothetical protein